MKKKPSVWLIIIGTVLLLAGIFGMIVFTLSVWYVLSDPEQTALSVRLTSVSLTVLMDAACFGLTALGLWCIQRYIKRFIAVEGMLHAAAGIQPVLRCPECGAALAGEKGARVTCPYCRTNVSL